MSTPIKLKHSAVQDRRPIPTGLMPGEIAVATHTASPGIFFRDSNDELVKVGPTYLGATAPTPVNHAVLLKGETWWDGDAFRIWNGITWEIVNKLSADFALPVVVPETEIISTTITSLTISEGAVTVLSGSNRIAISSPSAITKTLSSWAAGDGNGALIGSVGPSTWLHVFCVYSPTTADVDFAISSSLNPSLPSGFTYKRRIGSILISNSNYITPFTQAGDLFMWSVPVQDLRSVRVPPTQTNYRLTVPLGIQTEVRGTLSPGRAGLNQNLLVSVFSPYTEQNLDGSAINAAQYNGFAFASSSGSLGLSDSTNVTNPAWLTNTSAELSFISNDTYRDNLGWTGFTTYGWVDLGLRRGI